MVTLGGAGCIFCPPWPLQRTSRKNRNPGHLNIQTEFPFRKNQILEPILHQRRTNLPTFFSTHFTLALSLSDNPPKAQASFITVDRFLPLHKLVAAANQQPRRHLARSTTDERRRLSRDPSRLRPDLLYSPFSHLLPTPRGPRSVIRACPLYILQQSHRA